MDCVRNDSDLTNLHMWVDIWNTSWQEFLAILYFRCSFLQMIKRYPSFCTSENICLVILVRRELIFVLWTSSVVNWSCAYYSDSVFIKWWVKTRSPSIVYFTVVRVIFQKVKQWPATSDLWNVTCVLDPPVKIGCVNKSTIAFPINVACTYSRT